MAEPTNPGQPSDSSTERGTPVNVSDATVGTVTVTRMDVATGEVKELQVDLLKALNASIGEQTETLSSVIEGAKERVGGRGGPSDETLKGLEKAILALVQKPTGGGGDDGGGGPGGGIGDVISAGRDYTAVLGEGSEEAKEFAKKMRSGRFELDMWTKLFTKGSIAGLQNQIDGLKTSIFRFSQDLTDLRSGFNKVWQEGKRVFEMSQTGLVEVTAIYEDLGAAALKNRDAMIATADTLKEMASGGTVAIGILGRDVEEVATTFKRNRELIDKQFGEEYLQRIPFEQQNELLTEILVTQKRMGVMGSDEAILTSRGAREQMDMLKLIAAATGKTVTEIMKLQDEEKKTMAELVANNIISQDQANSLIATQGVLRNFNMGGIADLLQKSIEEGGVKQGLLMLQQDPGMAQFLGVGENRQLFQQSIEAAADKTMKPEDAAQLIQENFARMSQAGMDPVVMAQLRKEFPILAEVGKARGEALLRQGGQTIPEIMAEQRRKEGEAGAGITGAINTLSEFITNNFGTTGPLILAVLANTFALWRNTVGRGLGGGRGKGMALETTAQATKRVAAQNAAKGAAGKGAGRFASMGRGVAGAATAAMSTTAGALLTAGAIGAAVGHFVVGPLIDAGIEKSTGVEGATLGTTDAAASFFEAIGLGHKEDEEQKRRVEKMTQDVIRKAAERRKAKRAAEVAKGVSTVKGVAPTTPGDVAVVAPSEVTNPEAAKAPEDNPMNAELIKQTVHFETLIDLITQGNITRTNMLDVIGQTAAPVPGKHSSPRTRRGAHSPVDAYTPLYEGGPS